MSIGYRDLFRQTCVERTCQESSHRPVDDVYEFILAASSSAKLFDSNFWISRSSNRRTIMQIRRF
jgi:hypothetical protein